MSLLRVFRDEKLNYHLNKYGYACIDLLNQEQVDSLLTFYNKNPINANSGFHTTHFSTDKDLKKSIHNYITTLVWPELNKFLVDFKSVFSNFMIKEPREDSVMPLHADWTYVDETASCSIAAWIPLCDTNQENGTFGVIPFSQHLSGNIRGPRILQWEYPFNEEIIGKAGKLINMKSGQAIVYNHKLLHFSPPNNGEKTRHAINISMVPLHTELIHYTIPEGFDKIQIYKPEDEAFYLDYDNFQVPNSGTKIDEINRNKAPLLNDQLKLFLKKYYNSSIISRFKSLLKI